MPDATQYLRFEQVPREGLRTEVWHVISVRHGDVLGTIAWYGAWRQYAFYPTEYTVWNPDCMDAINAKIRGLMAARRAVPA